LKSNSSPNEAVFSSERSKRRNSVVISINNTFFHGVMSPSWYTDIDTWFDRYKFDEDVMMYLFRHCYDNDALCKNYIVKVADNWFCRGIQNAFQLEKYMDEHKLFVNIKGKIIKKLKLNRNLTEYEDKILEKWYYNYKYDFDIIEIALQMTTGKTHPSFRYLDAVIKSWFENNLHEKAEVLVYCENKKQSRQASKDNYASNKPIQSTNYEQRNYDDEYFNNLYDNVEFIK
jgi:DnaD/phage-associated family protein